MIMNKLKVSIVILGVLLILFLGYLLFFHDYDSSPKDPTASNGESVVQTEDTTQPTSPGSSEQTKPTEPEEKPDETESTTKPDLSTEPAPSSGSGKETSPTTESKSTAPSHTHSYKETVVKPTCTEDGYTLHQCSCGEKYQDSTKKMLGHKYTSKTVAPTIEAKGYTQYTCSACGHQYKDNYTDPLPSATESTKPSDVEKDPGSGQGGSSYAGGGGTPETEDYGFCPECGLRIWTTWYPQGCFTFLEDTVCDCGEFVPAMECHHH